MPLLKNFQCTKSVFSSFLPYEWLNILFFFFLNCWITHIYYFHWITAVFNLVGHLSCIVFPREVMSESFIQKTKAKTNRQICSNYYRIELQSQFSLGYLLRKRWTHLSVTSLPGFCLCHRWWLHLQCGIKGGEQLRFES